MELQEEFTALKSELEQYKSLLENSNAERIALDQMYVIALKNEVTFRKEVLLQNNKINELTKSLKLLNDKSNEI